MRTTSLAALAAAGALAAPAAAGAHVTVQPPEGPAGGFARIDVRVPNERDDQGTTKVDVRMPAGIVFATYEPVPGWEVRVRREKLDEPVDIGGFEASEQVSRITWTGDGEQGIIGPGQFRDFGLQVRLPDGAAGDELVFKALQTYEDGEVVRWIGPEDAEEPAAVVRLTAGAGGGGHGAPSAAGAAGETDTDGGAAPAAGASEATGDGGTDALTVVALVLGGLGLVAGLAGLAAARGRRAVAA